MPSAKSWDSLYTSVPVTEITENAITNTVTFRLKETADFHTSTSNIGANEPLTVYNNSFGNSLTYEWNFGEGATPQTSTEEGPISVSYSTLGTKTITLTVNGSITKQKTIEVYDPATTINTIVLFQL